MPNVLSHKRLKLAALAARPPQRPARSPDVAVSGLRLWAVQEPVSARTYVVLRVDTDAGHVGYGESHASPNAAAALARFSQAEARLIGQDAQAGESIRLLLADFPAEARAAVDMALLDIQGKVASAPAYDVLSGRTRDKVRAYAPLHGSGFDELKASLDRARAAGYRAFSLPLELPPGPTRGRVFFRETLALAERLRAAGADDLVLDCAGRASAAEAAVLAAQFESFHLLWLDEPTSEINEEALRKISSETVTPVGWGRSIRDNSEFQDLFRLQAVDVIRPDLALYGVRYARRAAALAEAYYSAIAPTHRGGPIATAAGMHLAASTPNFFIQEVPYPAADADLAMREALAGRGLEKPDDGFLKLPDTPGLGVEVNEDVLNQYEVRA